MSSLKKHNVITLRNDDSAEHYAKIADLTKHYDRYEKMFNLIKHCLLNGSKMTVLNVGSGPNDVVEEFVYHMMPYCKNIILNEMNPIFCDEYRYSAWYKQNKSRIIILKGDIRSILRNKHKNVNMLKNIDLIWCNHMIYHIRLNETASLIDEFSRILTSDPRSGYIFISCLNNNEPLITKLFRQIIPNYELCSHIDNILKKKNAKYTQIIDQHNYEFKSKEEALNLFKLFVIGDIYSNPDYKPSLPLSENEEIMLTALIRSHLDTLLIKNQQKYIWNVKATFFIIRKIINSNLSKL